MKKQKAIQVISIKKSLQEFASDSYTPVKECDFTLHGVVTYIKTSGMEAFGKYNSKQKEIYQDHDKLINDRAIFRQMYQITLDKKNSCTFNLDYTIEKDELLTHPLLLLEPTSIIPYQQYKPQELFTLLIKEINKIKAWNGILVGFLSDAMLQDVKKLVKQIYTKQFTSTASILLFSGIEPEMAKASRLILHFEAKHEDSQIKEVEADELIVEYIKPIYGKNGLNALGKQINRGNFDNQEFLDCKIDEKTIERKEDSERILLYSKKRGFVNYDKKMMEISNKVTLQQVKRVQSQVAKEEENEVEIVITQDDITEDTIGEGVHLTSETIHISGYVADKAVLEAKELIIDGASHNGSKLFAREAKINRHKGILRCHKADIKLLEGGEIHATNVTVDAALGGTIYAENITIRNVKHHLKVYATKSITIEQISGEDNLFVIDYKQIPIIKSRLEYIEEDIDELRYHLDEAKRHRESDVPKINKKITTLKAEVEAIKTSVFDATISIKERVKGINRISFSLPKNRELTFRTHENSKYEPFHIKHTDDRATLEPVGLSVEL
ncbi:MAG: flagellar assembly protein A [Campylobacterota bacterium]|nr:flagellar assembly protein A [Campylobacterota bacterium]